MSQVSNVSARCASNASMGNTSHNPYHTGESIVFVCNRQVSSFLDSEDNSHYVSADISPRQSFFTNLDAETGSESPTTMGGRSRAVANRSAAHDPYMWLSPRVEANGQLENHPDPLLKWGHGAPLSSPVLSAGQQEGGSVTATSGPFAPCFSPWNGPAGWFATPGRSQRSPSILARPGSVTSTPPLDVSTVTGHGDETFSGHAITVSVKTHMRTTQHTSPSQSTARSRPDTPALTPLLLYFSGQADNPTDSCATSPDSSYVHPAVPGWRRLRNQVISPMEQNSGYCLPLQHYQDANQYGRTDTGLPSPGGVQQMVPAYSGGYYSLMPSHQMYAPPPPTPNEFAMHVAHPCGLQQSAYQSASTFFVSAALNPQPAIRVGVGIGAPLFRAPPPQYEPETTATRGSNTQPHPHHGPSRRKCKKHIGQPLTEPQRKVDRSTHIAGFAVVKSKCEGGRYATQLSKSDLALWTHVLIEADRGDHIGVVIGYVSIPEMFRDCIAIRSLNEKYTDGGATLRPARESCTHTVANPGTLQEDHTSNSLASASLGGLDLSQVETKVFLPAMHNEDVATDEEEHQRQLTDVLTLKPWPWVIRKATPEEVQALWVLRALEVTTFATADSIVSKCAAQCGRSRARNAFLTTATSNGTVDSLTVGPEASECATEPNAFPEHSKATPLDAEGTIAKLVDCQYQFDRQKLTLYILRPSKKYVLNFRRMQRKLHRAFGCRIWVAYCDELADDMDSVSHHRLLAQSNMQRYDASAGKGATLTNHLPGSAAVDRSLVVDDSGCHSHHCVSSNDPHE